MAPAAAPATSDGAVPLPASRLWALGLLVFLLMLPETLPVPVLKALVRERFQVDDGLTSLFMSANMLGGLLVLPLVGLLADRFGRRRLPAFVALLLDAALMQALAHPSTYPLFLALRLLEGAAHLSALTLVMALVTDAAGIWRGRALGTLGAGLTLGVATGAAVGGVLGRDDPLRTLHVASIVLVGAAALAIVALPHDVAATARPSVRAQLRAVRERPGMLPPLLLAFVDRFTVGFFVSGFPLLLAGVHGVPRATIGMLLGAFLYPFALLSYPCGRLAERWSRAWLVGVGSVAYGGAVMLVGVVSPTLLWVVMPLCGVASAVMFVPTMLWLLERSPGVGRATALAAFHGIGSLGFLLGPLCCGAIAQLGPDPSTGYALAFCVAGLLEIGGAGLVVASMRRRPTG